MTKQLTTVLSFALAMLLSFSTQAAAMYTTYQAKIIKPDGTPLESTNVNFRFTILDPLGACILYTENFNTINMAGTGGLVYFSLGSGIKTFPVSGSVSFSDIFNNYGGALSCATGGPPSYSPVSNDLRKIVMQFHDGSGWQTLPAMSINHVPYAMYAQSAASATTAVNSTQLNGKTDLDFVQVTSVPTCSASQALQFNGASFGCVTVGSSGSGGTVVSGTAPIAISGSASAPVISISVASVSSDGYLTAADYAEFKTKLSASSTQIVNTLGYAPVSSSAVAAQIASAVATSNFAGDISGIISNITVNRLQGVSVTVTSLTANDILQYDGSKYINKNIPTCSGSQYLTFNGTSFSCAADAGASGTIASLSVTGPISSTGGANPTLSIAQANATTNGYLSSADWTTFNNKQNATSAAIIATLGYTPANATSATQWITNASDIYYNTGYVGVGTATPQRPIHVSDGGSASTALSPYSIEAFGFSPTLSLVKSSLPTLGSELGTIQFSSGNMSIYTNSSQIKSVATQNWTAGSSIGSRLDFITTENGTVDTLPKMTIDHNGKVGIGTTTPMTKLDVSGAIRISMDSASCAASYAGALRYNAGNVQFCDGSVWASFGVAGAGIAGLNGSTSGTQSFAMGVAGNSPAFNTANGVHTLNIPLASAGSVTAGLISNSDYTTFMNKITSSAASIAQVLGYTPASATALGNYLVKANNLSDITSSATARANLGLGSFATANTLDLGSASATGILAAARLPSFVGDVTSVSGANTLTLVNSGVSAATYTKVTVNAKGLVTSGSQLTASDVTTALGYSPASASASTQWTTSGTTINYMTGNVGIGTTNPTNKLDVNGSMTVGWPNLSGIPANSLAVGNKVGIGVGNPSYALQVFGQSSAAVAHFAENANNTNGGAIWIQGTDTGSKNWEFRSGGSASYGGAGAFSINNQTDGVNIITIKPTGNVGIGITSPNVALDVSGSTEVSGNLSVGANLKYLNDNQLIIGSAVGYSNIWPTISMNGSGAGINLHDAITGSNMTDGSYINLSSGDLNINNQEAKNISLSTSGTTRLRIDSAGNVGIGTTAPTTNLHVSGTVKITGGSPGAGKVLTSDASGLASWQSATGDNLGNHTATQNINLGIYKLVGQGGSEGITIDSAGNIRLGSVGGSTGVTLGPSTTASGSSWGSMAAGFMSTASSISTFALGNSVTASNWYAFATGNNNTASGRASAVFGENMTVSGNNSIGFGLSSAVSYTISAANTLAIMGGNVGIGTVAPINLMHAHASAGNTVFRMSNASTGTTGGDGFVIQQTATDVNLINYEAGSMGFQTLAAERMRITSAGAVGIGTTAPSEALEVSGNVKATSFITASDRRLKENIQTSRGLDLILNLHGVSYNWKRDGKKEYGLIAQEVEQVLPELVVTDQVSGMKGVRYQSLVSPLIEATKELYYRCEDQKKMVDAELQNLKQKNERLEAQVDELKEKLEEIERYLKLSKKQKRATASE